MNNKKQTRKPLSDALAQEFVYGENSTPAVTPKPIEISEPQPIPQPETTFMDRLQVQPKDCKMSFNDLKTCPKMVLKHSSFWILKSTVNTIQYFVLLDIVSS
jgi:hypothetical protein